MSLVLLVEPGDGGGLLNGAARVMMVVGGYEEGCLDPATIEFHGGALDLEVEMARKEKPRTSSTTGASTMVNTSVLVLGFKP
jgi:hypothetical protein